MVVPLVQTNFYATDAEGRGTMVFFFRNTFWRQKEAELTEQEEVSEESVEELEEDTWMDKLVSMLLSVAVVVLTGCLVGVATAGFNSIRAKVPPARAAPLQED